MPSYLTSRFYARAEPRGSCSIRDSHEKDEHGDDKVIKYCENLRQARAELVNLNKSED